MTTKKRTTMMTTKVYEVTDQTYKKTVAWLLQSMKTPIPNMMIDEWEMGWRSTPGLVSYDPKNRYYYDTDRKTKLIQGHEEKLEQQEWVYGDGNVWIENGTHIYVTKQADVTEIGKWEKRIGPKICIEINGGINQIYLLVFRQNLLMIKNHVVVKYS